MTDKNIRLNKVEEKVLYHYTKSNGINGILNNNCFWATKNDFLNDPNEFLYINKIIRRVCLDLLYDEELTEMLLTDVVGETDANGEYFVLSFSCCRDSITMWAEFGNANGYNIGFDSNEIIKRIEEANQVEYHGMVIYDSNIQSSLIQDIINTNLPAGMSLLDIARIGKENNKDVRYCSFCEAFREATAVYAMFFKDEAFMQEREYRFVFGKNEETKINFRVRDGYIIPYISIPLSDMRLPVTEIVVAPKNHIDLAKKGMDYMMKALDYNVPVELSDIKLRY